MDMDFPNALREMFNTSLLQWDCSVMLLFQFCTTDMLIFEQRWVALCSQRWNQSLWFHRPFINIRCGYTGHFLTWKIALLPRETAGAIHLTKISGSISRNFRTTSGGCPQFSKRISRNVLFHLIMYRNFRKFWSNGSRPAFSRVTDVSRGKFPVLNIHGYVKKITRSAHDI